MIELKTSRKSAEQNGASLRNGNRSPTTRGFLDKTKSTLEKKLKRASWSPDKSPILDLGLEIANFGIKINFSIKNSDLKNFKDFNKILISTYFSQI
jgi:hypothetical protein